MSVSIPENHVGLMSLVNIVIYVTLVSFQAIVSRSGVLHVLTDEFAFVSPLNYNSDFGKIRVSDHFFLLA